MWRRALYVSQSVSLPPALFPDSQEWNHLTSPTKPPWTQPRFLNVASIRLAPQFMTTENGGKSIEVLLMRRVGSGEPMHPFDSHVACLIAYTDRLRGLVPTSDEKHAIEDGTNDTTSLPYRKLCKNVAPPASSTFPYQVPLCVRNSEGPTGQ